MAKYHLQVAHGRSICDAPAFSHNRWHPDIAAVLHIKSGDTVEIATRDSLDGQIRPDTPASDLAERSLDSAHVLTGPIHVEGAAPGDLLAVHILDVITPAHGFTVVLPGLGLLKDIFNTPFLLHWELADGYASCRDLPGIRIPGAPFMGVMGLAPSRQRLLSVNRREAAAARAGALVFPPLAKRAVPALPTLANEAWRTVAAHAVGGNMDVRQLIAGATLHLPVDVPGALFSTGDAHFAQGDGESCGTAIETSATLLARFELLKGAAHARRQTAPSWFVPGPPRQDGVQGYFATTGLSVDVHDVIHAGDATLAARNATLAMIDMLGHDYGLSPEQAYCVVSVAGDLRISSIVNTPHALVSVVLPRAIFAGSARDLAASNAYSN